MAHPTEVRQSRCEPSTLGWLELDVAALEGRATALDALWRGVPFERDPAPGAAGDPGSGPRDDPDRGAERDLLLLAGARVVAPWSGSALGLALFARALARSRPLPFVVAVPAGVGAELPTAARAVCLGRSALGGHYVEGLVGSELGAALAALGSLLAGERVLGALALEGALSPAAHGRGAVLVLGAQVEVRVLAALGDAPADRVHARLVDELGPCASLAIGPGGRHGVSFASLAAGGDPPHFVGRGLGATFAASGLTALAVVPGRADRTRAGALDHGPRRALTAALASSPRLAARAAGGTFELYDAYAVGGEDERGSASPAPDRATGRRTVGDALVERAAARHGCRGCPTPCGWSFDVPVREERARDGEASALERASMVRTEARAERIGARFGALEAFRDVLGERADGLALLARCDALGLDSKEAAARLALACRAQERGRFLASEPRARGVPVRLATWLDAIAARSGPFATLARELDVAAEEFGLADAVTTVRGAWVRPRRDRAALLGVCVSPRGSDPTRAFPFTSFGAGATDLAALVEPMPLPVASADPEAPEGKGRLVWWHENLANAIDLSGFCAFSAAGLVVDGIADLDQLARWIAPAALRAVPGFEARPGVTLLAAGAALARLQRAVGERLAARAGTGRPQSPVPPAFAAALAGPGMLDELRTVAGLDSSGRLTPAAWNALTDPWGAFDPTGGLPAEGGAWAAAARSARRGPVGERRPGRVALRASGPLGAALGGGEVALELDLPCALDEVLTALAERVPAAAPLLRRGERVLPAVFRGGGRLAEHALVADGDRLDLVLAIAGG